jgi:ABC-type branched-subunit amino acid transport system substrate-binding protein
MHHHSESRRRFGLAYAIRHFFCTVTCVVFVLPLTSSGARGQSTAHNSLRIGLLTAARANSISRSIERGVHLGAAEARQTANLFGNDVELFEAPAAPSPVARAAKLLSERKVQVIIGSSPDDADALSRFAQQSHIVFLNVASRSPELRSACRRNTFHIEASDAMYSAAESLATRPASRAGREALTAGHMVSTNLWSPTLEKYGASQINDRFRARYGTGMDGGAWAGWAAVKMVSESSLRARSNDASKLIAYLESPGTTFDGHKGWPLSFRAVDHQLRQPLYVATRNPAEANRETVRDVPELRGGGTEAAPAGGARLNPMLDRIVGAPPGAGCGWAR